MGKKGKSDAHWRGICNLIAAGNEPSGRGWNPGGTWKKIVDKIKKCPVTQVRKQSKNNGKQTTLQFASSAAVCNCGWNHGNEKAAAESTNTATAGAQPSSRPPKEVDFGILRKPDPRRSINDVRGICKVYHQKDCFDLQVFGYVTGRCIHCKSSNIAAGNLNSSVKLIYTTTKPRFVQGIGLTCNDCKGKGWQSFEKTYVDTLSKAQQSELNAVIAGKRNGVDFGIITQMRMGATAASIEKQSLAELTKLHAQWEENYDEKCRIAKRNGHDVVERSFPTLVESGLVSFSAKPEIVTVGFIRDYITVKPELLREMASYKAEKSMAIDHQRKVVKHAVGNNGSSSFTVIGDAGIMLGYYVVPDDGELWLKKAMLEIVERHGAVLNPDFKTLAQQGSLPKVIYVDKLCCGGTEGSRADAVRYFYGMLKKLDSFHLIQRIGREMNCEHPRKGQFLVSLSECIFTLVQEDVDELEEARITWKNKRRPSQKETRGITISVKVEDIFITMLKCIVGSQ